MAMVRARHSRLFGTKFSLPGKIPLPARRKEAVTDRRPTTCEVPPPLIHWALSIPAPRGSSVLPLSADYMNEVPNVSGGHTCPRQHERPSPIQLDRVVKAEHASAVVRFSLRRGIHGVHSRCTSRLYFMWRLAPMHSMVR